MNGTFYTISGGDVAVTITVIVTFLIYRLDLKKEKREVSESRIKVDREIAEAKLAAVREQAKQHEENKNKLNILLDFHKEQMIVNQKRDKQINELTTQTGILLEIAKGLSKRLELIENKGA